METKRAVVMVECRVELMRPMDPTPVDDHHDLFLGSAEDRHHLVDIVAQVLRIKVGHDFIEDFRGAILDRADDVQQDPAADPAPGAMLRPDLAFEGFFPFDAVGAERAGGQTIALDTARPPSMQEGKTPHDSLVRVEQDDLAAPRPILQSSQVDGALGEVCGRGIEASRGTTVAQRIFLRRHGCFRGPSGSQFGALKPSQVPDNSLGHRASHGAGGLDRRGG
jgi:hypothetical protein